MFFVNIPFFTIYFNLAFLVNHSLKFVKFSAILVPSMKRKLFLKSITNITTAYLGKMELNIFDSHNLFNKFGTNPLLPLPQTQIFEKYLCACMNRPKIVRAFSHLGLSCFRAGKEALLWKLKQVAAVKKEMMLLTRCSTNCVVF